METSAIDELMIMHGIEGGRGMAARLGRCRSWSTIWDPITGTYVRKCASRSRPQSRRGIGLDIQLGELAEFGQASDLKGTLAGLKGVFVTGGIAAGGALVTDRVFEMLQKQLKLKGYVAVVVKMASGVVLGIMISKVFKKPSIGAAFAIGPVVSGLVDVIHQLTGKAAPATSGLGLITAERIPEYERYLPAGIGAVEVTQTSQYPEYLLNVGTQRQAYAA